MDSFIKEKGTVSVRTIAKHFKMKRSKVNGYLKRNSDFVKVTPDEVGSGKQSVNVWKCK